VLDNAGGFEAHKLDENAYYDYFEKVHNFYKKPTNNVSWFLCHRSPHSTLKS